MRHNIKIQVVNDDAFNCAVDVLILKHAQNLYGLDRAVFLQLNKHGKHVVLPMEGASFYVNTSDIFQFKSTLFVGVPPLNKFNYSEIRDFSRTSLAKLTNKIEVGQPEVIGFTIHGAGYGLDEIEAFSSQFAGITEAITTGNFPKSIREIHFIEADSGRAARIKKALSDLLPTGDLVVEVSNIISSLDSSTQNTLRSIGYNSSSKPHAFVAMPFSPEMDDIYHYGIQGAVKSTNLLCERADLSSFTGDVMNWVKSRISTASIVIADLSSSNPNVYLEVGYAWGCKIPTILLVKSEQELKFDVRGQRCLVYNNSIKSLEESLKHELSMLSIHTYN